MAPHVFAICASENCLTKFRSKSFVFQWYSFLLFHHGFVSQTSVWLLLVGQCSGCGAALEIWQAIQIAAIKKQFKIRKNFIFVFDFEVVGQFATVVN